MSNQLSDIFQGQFDAVFTGSTKTRDEYAGDYDAYLAGARQVNESKIHDEGNKNAKGN